ncbi:unnamed protein product [Linum trigynum]|uniref:Uncharacterized protein n=1 Tax=Linum trigynum TaxID=586398 RepID=A0AAV2GLC2_9ROSI
MAPDPPVPVELPACCREILTEYSGEMKKLGDLLFQLLSEALGLRSNHLKEIGCVEGIVMGCHYYPAGTHDRIGKTFQSRLCHCPPTGSHRRASGSSSESMGRCALLFWRFGD